MWSMIVVEDNRMVRQSICESIEWTDIGVQLTASFQNGSDAYEYLKEHSIDVVVTDIVMPMMDGIELAKIINQKEWHTKVIFLSAYNEFEYAQSAINFGVYAYVSKPVENKSLKDTVLGALDMLEKEQQIQWQVERSQPIIKRQFCEQLLHNSINKETFENDCKYLNIKFFGEEYLCLILELDFLYQNLNMEKREIFLFTLLDITQQCMENLQKNIISFIHGNEQIVVFLWKEILLDKKNIYEIFEDIRNQTQKRIGMTISVGVGLSMKNIYDIYRSYNYAQEALKQRYLEGGDKVFVCEVPEKGKDNEDDTYIDEDEFIDSIKYSTMTQVETSLIKLRRILYLKEKHYHSSRSWIYYFLSHLFKLRCESEEKEEEVTSHYITMLEEMSQSATFDELFQVLDHYTRCARRSIEKMHCSKKKQIVEKAKLYIQQNFSNTDMSLERISESVFLSKSYLSSIFKNDTGKTLTEYISQIRISTAKELLKNTDKKILQIAECTGYINQFYFSACFKKIVGVSPQEFRNDSETTEDVIN